MSLNKFANVDAAVQHAKQLRKSPMTAAQVVEYVTLEAELVNLGIGYVAVPISAADVAVKPVVRPARAPVVCAVDESAEVAKPSAGRSRRVSAAKAQEDDKPAAQDDDKPAPEALPEGF